MKLTKGRSKSEAKREKIIDAACELFLQQGYEKCSMDEIAKLAGVSKQTLYSHFGSKEQLFSDAIECTCQQYHLWNEGSDTKSGEQFLEEFCVNMAHLLISAEALGVQRACVSEAGRSQIAELFWQAGPSKIRQQLQDFLREQHQQGQLKIDDLNIATSQLIAMLHGEAHTKLLLGVTDTCSIADLERYARSCAALFFKAHQP